MSTSLMYDEDYTVQSKKTNPISLAGMLAIPLVLIIIAYMLLKDEALYVIEWWICLIFFGIGMLPLDIRLLKPMGDKGYFTGKLLGIAISGYLTWILSYIGLPFTGGTCVVVSLVVFAAVWGGCFLYDRLKNEDRGLLYQINRMPTMRVFTEEMVFLALMIMWGYFIGFRPEAFGTEKMMDYGFVVTMMKSNHLPVTDMWYSEGIINYYYGGQFFAAFLGKLTFTGANYTYNLMRVMIAATAPVMAYSICSSILARAGFEHKTKRDITVRNAGGILCALAMCFAGNMHYVIVGKLVPMAQELLGMEAEKYWFPNSTRYIGYRPDVADKTIHEFPSYSFILGDLHAHMINILFVLPMIALLLCFVVEASRKVQEQKVTISLKEAVLEVFSPSVITMTLLIAIYQWTNYWDYPIYFGLAGLVILFANIRKYHKNVPAILGITAGQAAVALLLAALLIMPFTRDFDSIFSGVALTDRHTQLYQWLILWGLPTITTVIYLIASLVDRKEDKAKGLRLCAADLFIVIMGVWGLVLLMVPEVMYVKDIYGDTYQRSNTMFKFTYQAYMILSVTTSYGIIRMLTWKGDWKKTLRKIAIVSLVLTLWTCGYFGKSVNSWFGDITKMERYKTLDATAYIEEKHPENAAAIRYVEENIPNDAVVLEANGDSYTESCMCSAMTGHPTVLGWYTHERLWRNDTDDLNNKAADIKAIYTSDKIDQVKMLLEKYHISYIFVGTNEWKKYETVNIDMLDQVGEVVFEVQNTSNNTNTDETSDSADHVSTRVYKIK